jgi:TolA-binding protein
LKQYDKAIPYLSQYKGKKEDGILILSIGLCSLQAKDFESAISQFNKIINGKDFVAQNAYYHLGESYLNLDKSKRHLMLSKTHQR